MTENLGDLVAEVKKIREENEEMQRIIKSTLSDSSSKLDSCELLREFFAMKTDLKMVKKELEEQRIAYKTVCDELRELKVKQDGDEDQNRSFFNQVFTNQEKSCKLSQKSRDDQRTTNKAIFTELAECKLEQHDQKDQSETLLNQISAVRDDLEALKLKQIEDVTVIREEADQMKKANDATLQNHDYELGIRKVTLVEEVLVGKWKMVSSTGREEYEKLITKSFGSTNKISYDNRNFTYSGGSLNSYVGPYMDTHDPVYTSEYIVNNRTLTFKNAYYNSMFQWISIWIENSQLIVEATIYQRPESKDIANCKCVYNRV